VTHFASPGVPLDAPVSVSEETTGRPVVFVTDTVERIHVICLPLKCVQLTVVNR